MFTFCIKELDFERYFCIMYVYEKKILSNYKTYAK